MFAITISRSQIWRMCQPESLNAFWDDVRLNCLGHRAQKWGGWQSLRNKWFGVTKVRNIFERANRLVQQISMAGAGVSTFFICLRTKTRSYINSYSTSSFSLLSWVNFSLNFCPNLRGAFCLHFSRKMAVLALFVWVNLALMHSY
jgi:hypothetical protein